MDFDSMESGVKAIPRIAVLESLEEGGRSFSAGV